jgi:uncharacterized membrane protein YkvA (DUF1232 family)
VNVLRIVLGLLVALALAWLIFVAFLVVVRPRGMNLKEARRFVPDLARLLRDLSRDPAASRKVRRRLVFLLVYLAMPIDLVPDFIPGLGYADDVIVIAFVLRSTVRVVGADTIEGHWRGTPEGLSLLRRLTGIQPK